MDFKAIVDKLIEDMKQEYASAHEATTKAFNFEYAEGKLYGLYDIARMELSPEDFADLYDYRRADRDEISNKFNQEYVNPIYSTTTESRASEMQVSVGTMFSESDLLTLSTGLLALIDNAVKADALVTTEAAHGAIKEEIQAYRRLNYKVCNIMED